MTKISENNNKVQITAIPQRNYVLNGVKNKIQVLFKIETGSSDSESRIPANLSLVLDRSGSMSGSKIEHSKKALVSILQQLSKDDTVHFVTYDNSITEVFKNEKISNGSQIEVLSNMIESVDCGGCTNLGGGLNKGIELSRDWIHENSYICGCSSNEEDKCKDLSCCEKKKRTSIANSRVFLFSDGLVNNGITNKAKLYEISMNGLEMNGIVTTTLGIGSDYDEVLMRELAENGGGKYFYIDSSENIPFFVQEALKGLTQSIGIKARFTVKGKGCCVVNKIWGHPDPVKGAMVGDLSENNCRSILVEVELSPTENNSVDEILTYQLEYQTISNERVTTTTTTTSEKENEEEKEKKIENIQKITGTLKINFTSEEKLVNDSHNVEVDVYEVLQNSSETTTKSLELMNEGKKNEALEMERNILKKLQEVESKDTSKQVSEVIKYVNSTISKIEKSGITSSVYKETYQGYHMMTYCDSAFTYTYANQQ